MRLVFESHSRIDSHTLAQRLVDKGCDADLGAAPSQSMALYQVVAMNKAEPQDIEAFVEEVTEGLSVERKE